MSTDDILKELLEIKQQRNELVEASLLVISKSHDMMKRIYTLIDQLERMDDGNR